ncbi:sensor histidine kinase [Bacteroides heparinolyticus]|uniref:sensor histidine kinase n=1 Tax=Prevotella heparinolytica TaxID=28113 RepID=UPI0035A0632C
MKNIIKVILFLSLCCYASAAYAQQQDRIKEEILIISSYSYESKYIYNNITKFVNEYTQLGGKYSPVVESLSCLSLDGRSKWMDNLKAIIDKHPNPKFIVLLGPESWSCYFSLTEEKYKKIPLGCIMGQRYGATFTDDSIPSLQVKDIDVQGIVDYKQVMKEFNVRFFRYYEYDVDSSCRLITHLFPSTKNIAVISDNTYLGLSEMRIIKHTIEKNYPHLNPIYIDGSRIDLDEALHTTASLPENTSAILCIWRFDKKNVIYMNNAEYLFKEANKNLPVFSFTGTGIGYWCIGGSIPKYNDEMGVALARHVYQYIDQEDKTMPAYISGFQNEFRFDMQKVKDFNLSKKMLPEESVYINNSTDWKAVFHIYKWYLILIFLVIILLAAGFIVSIRYSWHIRQLRNKLIEDKKRLEDSERELRLAKDKAEESNRLKSAFISNMSHEIRTPLNAIVGFATILEEETKDNENLKEFVNIISYNSDLLLKLINDILDLSRLESGKQNFNFSTIDLVLHCHSIVNSMQANINKGIKLFFRHSTPTVIVETDLTRFHQVLVNLIGNAAKFTQEGFIELSVKPDDEMKEWVFAVTDTGCGIPSDKQKAVFERFTKLNEYVQGTGLGLAICQITVRKLGGRIWIDPEYTQGTRFMFTIPYKHVRDVEYTPDC